MFARVHPKKIFSKKFLRGEIERKRHLVPRLAPVTTKSKPLIFGKRPSQKCGVSRFCYAAISLAVRFGAKGQTVAFLENGTRSFFWKTPRENAPEMMIGKNPTPGFFGERGNLAIVSNLDGYQKTHTFYIRFT